MVEKLYAPWSLATVKALKRRQADPNKHAYTCEWHSDTTLIPTHDGWICVINGCDYTQNWALKYDTIIERLQPSDGSRNNS